MNSIIRKIIIENVFGGLVLYFFKSRDILDKVGMP